MITMIILSLLFSALLLGLLGLFVLAAVWVFRPRRKPCAHTRQQRAKKSKVDLTADLLQWIDNHPGVPICDYPHVAKIQWRSYSYSS